MLLWVGFAVLSAAVLAAVLHPLLRASPALPAPADGATHDGAIYRDQLAEIAAERDRGLLAPAEAEAAEAEVARRLLAAESRGSDAAGAAAPGLEARSIALALMVALPLAAIGLYGYFGSPGLPGQPLSARLQKAPEANDVTRLIAAVEQRLRQHPEDGEGWDVIGPVYLRIGRYTDAADAFTRAIRIKGETAKRLAGLAESTVLASDGIVTETARAAYEKLSRLDPKRPEPRFWLALAKEQDGKLAEALAAYRALLDDSEKDAPWRSLVEERIGDVGKKLGQPQPPADPKAAAKSELPTRGPSAEDMQAAEKMPAADRQRMIEDMVQGLAERLAKDGRDLAGWQRLIRAYTVMGRKDDAVAALGKARGQFSDEPQSLSALADLAKTLGLES